MSKIVASQVEPFEGLVYLHRWPNVHTLPWDAHSLGSPSTLYKYDWQQFPPNKKIFDRLIEITIQVDQRFVILVDTNIPNYWGHIQENTFHRCLCVYVYICTYKFILVCSKKIMRRGDQNGIQKHCVSVNFLHWAAYTV